MSRTLFTSKGEPVILGRELGRGGEGSVYEVPALSDQVAKLYRKVPDSKKQAKLSFMASSADTQLLNFVAWPQETLYLNRRGPVVGFLMPKIIGKKPIHMIYSPAHRRQDYPKAAWDFLVYVARNVAASFEIVHDRGHVIGDVNQNSFMVGHDSKVVLIDSDSFQVNANGTLHLCEVGVSHFTPPELQSLSSFYGFTRTANHDNFGLALLIFHIIFGGRHPYSGVPLSSGVGDALETDIKNFRYAYARDNQSRGIKPPPRSIPISILSDRIESMLYLAFTERGASGARPTAQQWVAELDEVRGHLKKCGVSSMHVYPDHLSKCPWCGLEHQGVIYFIDLGSSFTQTSSGFVLTQVWGHIQAVSAPPVLNVPSPRINNVKAQPLPHGIIGKGTIMFCKMIVLAISISIFLAKPEALLISVFVGWLGWKIVCNVGSSKRAAAEASRRQDALKVANQNYDQLVMRIKKEAGPEGFNARKADLMKLREELENLPMREKQEIENLHTTARERQMKKFLSTYFIDSANIPGIGPARMAALRSFGIETADDISRKRVMQVRGFGESLTRAVLDWKASCERKFTFNPAAAVSQADRDAVRAKYAAKRVKLERILAEAPAQLQQCRQRAVEQRAFLQPQVEAAAKMLAQARADLSKLE